MNLLYLNNTLYLIQKPTNVAAYDFDFELFFQCAHPIYLDKIETGILRIGALADYEQTYQDYLQQNIQLINSPEEHTKASELAGWYLYIKHLTPYSCCYQQFPTAEAVEQQFGWPVFIKGSRQTSKHNPQLCIAHNTQEYEAITKAYQEDPILHWQEIAIRQFIPLMPIQGNVPTKINPSLEFRTFWWHNQCVGYGQYWYQLPPYYADDIETGLAVAQEAAEILNIPFLVIDIAKTRAGNWIVIECNDAQESGYTGVLPQVLWQNILNIISNSQ